MSYRELFEKWADENLSEGIARHPDRPGCYLHRGTQIAWVAVQAARSWPVSDKTGDEA